MSLHKNREPANEPLDLEVATDNFAGAMEIGSPHDQLQAALELADAARKASRFSLRHGLPDLGRDGFMQQLLPDIGVDPISLNNRKAD